MRRLAFAVVLLLPVAIALVGGGASADQVSLVAPGATWRYLADGSDQGSAWSAVSFADGSWPSGPAELGYGDGGEATVVGFGPDANAKYVTTYFRHAFSVADPGALGSLTLSVLRDDGAVVYLNGQEVYRSNMPGGPVGYQTLAASAVGGADESAWYSTTLAPAALVAGTNELAVEVHQSSGSSSDVSFDLQLVAGTPGSAPVVTRGPYLQMGSSTGVVVRWRTDQPCAGRVRYGTVVGSPGSFADEATPTTEHEVAVGGLQPETRYYYSVGTATDVLAGGDAGAGFVTSPALGRAAGARVWVLGDSGTASAGARAVRDAYQAYAGAPATGVWLMLGDNAYASGTDAQYQAALFDTYPAMLRRAVLWPTIGNHDTAQSQSPPPDLPYFQMFSLPTAGQAGGLPSGTEKYYSFDYGNIHFVCLDSQSSSRTSTAAGSMLDWLAGDLASTAQRWIIAYFHHPPYTKGSHDSDAEGQLREVREHVAPILEQGGVDLVLSGHSHSWERSYLLDGHYGVSSTLAESMKLDGGDGRLGGDGPYEKPSLHPAPHEGAVYVVMGSSGQTGGGPLNHPAMAVSSSALGSLVLDVGDTTLNAVFLRGDGGIGDSFTLVKGLLPPKPPANLSAAPAGAGAIVLAWTDASRFEQGFAIERRTSAGSWAEIAVAPADATTHLDAGLAPATAYAYRVRAFNGAGRSPSSNEAVATTPCADLVQLARTALVVGEGGRSVVGVVRLGDCAGVVEVAYSTSSNTAAAGADYVTSSGTLAFGPGETAATFSVATFNDTLAEGNESLNVSLVAGVGAVLGHDRRAIVTIADNDPAGTVQFANHSFVAGEGAGLASVALTRSNGASGAVTVAFATADNTATAGSDYVPASGLVTFANGQTKATFTVPVIGDADAEGHETVHLTLASPTGGALLGGRRRAVLTIVDDDSPAGGIAFAIPAFKVNEGGPGGIVIRRSDTSTAQAVSFTTADNGTAVAGSDYAAVARTVTFRPGQAAVSVAVPTLADGIAEGMESVNLSLADAAGGGTLGAQRRAVLVIDDDRGVLQLAAPSIAVGEAAGGVTVTVTRSYASAGTVTVDYATRANTARAGSDFSAVSGTLTFAPGQASAKVVIPIVDDVAAEGVESFNVILSAPTGGAVLGTLRTAVVVIADNERL